MFLDAIEHVSRISRVLRQPQGSTVLTHQHAVALLATHIERVSQKREDLRRSLLPCIRAPSPLSKASVWERGTLCLSLLLPVSLMCTDPVPAITSFLLPPAGNALLFGVGGSGRQSLTRLASFVSDYELFQIEISKGYGKNEWKDDLKSCLMRAGIDTKPIVFLFSDTQVCVSVCVCFPEQQFACPLSSFCAAACIVTAGFAPNSSA